MVLSWNREEGENQADDKDIINRQRLFDEKARVIFHAHVGPFLEPDPKAEQHRNTDVKRRQLQAFGDAHLFVFLVQNAKVKRGERDHDADKGQPEPNRCAQPVHHQKFHEIIPCIVRADAAQIETRAASALKLRLFKAQTTAKGGVRVARHPILDR